MSQMLERFVAPDIRTPEQRAIDDGISAVREQRRAELEAEYVHLVGAAHEFSSEEYERFSTGLGYSSVEFVEHKQALHDAERCKRAIANSPTPDAIEKLKAECSLAATAAHERALAGITGLFERASVVQILDAIPKIGANCPWNSAPLGVELDPIKSSKLEPLGDVVSRGDIAQQNYAAARNHRFSAESELAGIQRRFPFLFDEACTKD